MSKYSTLTSRTFLLFPLLFLLLNRPAFAATSAKISPDAPVVHYLGLESTKFPSSEPDRWKTDFTIQPESENIFGEYEAGNLVQRGKYNCNGFSLLVEMGDLVLKGTPNTGLENYRRGGQVTLYSQDSQKTVRINTFAVTGANRLGSEGVLAGVSNEFTLFTGKLRLKSIFMSGRESLDYLDSFGERKGDVIGLSAVFEPFKEKLAVEAEVDSANFDYDSTDAKSATKDKAYRIKAGGIAGDYRYSMHYERNGPDYNLISAGGPRRDSEGVGLGLGANYKQHVFGLSFSRYNDNLAKSLLFPRLYRSQGVLDYSFKLLPEIPIGLQYRKTLVDSQNEPAGYEQVASEEDAVIGRLNYKPGKWDLGLKANYHQRKKRLTDERQSSAATIVLAPRYNAGTVSVSPDVSLRRSTYFQERLAVDEYAAHLDIRGNACGRKLSYELRGGYRKETSNLSPSGKETLGASVKLKYPLAKLFKKERQPTVGFKGDYNGTSDRSMDGRNSRFSLLFMFEGGSFF